MNKKIVFINEIPKEFSQDKEFIENAIDHVFDAVGLNVEVKIKFDEIDSVNEYEKTDAALLNKSIKQHEVLIGINVLKTISDDGGAFFYQTIYHEFEHIKDYVKMMQTKQFGFNLCLSYHKNLEMTFVSKGFLFWTEILAYYKTIEMTQCNDLYFEKITFGNLVENYKKTVQRDKSLYYKQDLQYDEAMKYIKCVESFVYLCSKFIASVYANHSRIPHTKIAKDKDYKKVLSILCGLDKKIQKMIDNTYSEKSYENLFKLGKYICEDIQWKVFKVGQTKKNGKIVPFY